MTPTSSNKPELPGRFIPMLLRWFRRRSLLQACLLSIGGALLIAAFAWWLIGFPLNGKWTWKIGAGDTTRADAGRIVLTMVAGIGGIIALTIAYRKQRGTEEGRFMASLENAARQMGALEPTVQFAGIYALASLADESKVARKQKCVDVLCSYLRLPYTPTSGVSTLREIAERRTWFDARGEVEEVYTYQLRPAEKEVRLTIIRTIAERLRDSAAHSWSVLDLDFTGVVFDSGDFTDARFKRGRVSFDRAQFVYGDRVSFNDAQFGEGCHVSFYDAQFGEGCQVSFYDAQFEEGCQVSFHGAQFKEGCQVNFYGAKLKHSDRSSFYGAHFDDLSSVRLPEES